MILAAEDIRRLILQDEQGTLASIARVVNESEAAKQILRRNGFGVTGTGLLDTVREMEATWR